MDSSPTGDLLKDPEPAQVGRLASRGVLFLILRYGGLQLVGLAANIVLSRRLSPASFGVYALTLALLVLMTWVSDFGLGAALLQKRAAVRPEDLRTVFTIQQSLLGALAIVGLLLSPWIAGLYHLGAAGPTFVQAMVVGGLLASIRTVPTVVLERRLLYGRLTMIEVVDVLSFQITAVVLAVAGLGPWSFIWAVLVSKTAGTALAYLLARWRPGLGLDRAALGGLLWFALPFQLTWLTYLFRDYLIPILGGVLVGTIAVGYLNWALALSGVPGQMAQVVGRVSFPSLSRMQHDPTAFGRALEASIRALFLVAVPVEVTLLALAPWLIHFVFSDKWLPALLPLYLLALQWAAANLTTPLVSALNAVGRVRETLVLNAAWTGATLILAWALVRFEGFVGIAVAFLVTRLVATAAAWIMVRRVAPVRIWSAIRLPLAASVVTGAAGYAVTRLVPGDLLELVLTALSMGVLYCALLWLAEGRRLRGDIGLLITLLRPGPAAPG